MITNATPDDGVEFLDVKRPVGDGDAAAKYFCSVFNSMNNMIVQYSKAYGVPSEIISAVLEEMVRDQHVGNSLNDREAKKCSQQK